MNSQFLNDKHVLLNSIFNFFLILRSGHTLYINNELHSTKIRVVFVSSVIECMKILFLLEFDRNIMNKGT